MSAKMKRVSSYADMAKTDYDKYDIRHLLAGYEKTLSHLGYGRFMQPIGESHFNSIHFFRKLPVQRAQAR